MQDGSSLLKADVSESPLNGRITSTPRAAFSDLCYKVARHVSKSTGFVWRKCPHISPFTATPTVTPWLLCGTDFETATEPSDMSQTFFHFSKNCCTRCCSKMSLGLKLYLANRDTFSQVSVIWYYKETRTSFELGSSRQSFSLNSF